MISVIIPAFNESAVIDRTLVSVLKALESEPGEVIVVCNGCIDDTLDRCRKYAPRVQVIDLSVGSKTAALNAGNRLAQYFPRFYLDADIEVSSNAFSAVSSVLRGGKILGAAPEMKCNFADASWPVRAFYQIWLRRPYHLEGHMGSGFVGISQQGRQRFTEFPNIIADDEFLRRQLQPDERQVVSNAWFSIQTPQDVTSLIKVKTRSRLGTLQLQSKFPEFTQNARSTSKRACKASRLEVFDPKFFAYALITLIARYRANRQWKKNQVVHWERDESSRKTTTP